MWTAPSEPPERATVGLEVFWPSRGEPRPNGGVLLGYRRLLRSEDLRQVGDGGTVEPLSASVHDWVFGEEPGAVRRALA